MILSQDYLRFSALQQLPSNFQQLAVLAKERTNAVSYAEIHEAVNERFSQLVQRVLSIESGNTNEMAQAVSALGRWAQLQEATYFAALFLV